MSQAADEGRIEGEDRDLFARSLEHATSTSSGETLDAALAELGWADAMAMDPQTAVSLLFDLQGRANAVSGGLDTVLATALGADAGTAVVLPRIGSTVPPGTSSDGSVTIRGLATGFLARAERALVSLEGGGDALVFELGVDALDQRPAPGIDPDLGLIEVTATVPLAQHAEPAHWSRAVAAGQRAVGHELVGASRTMLSLAREHAVERIQFGQPIAKFQAIRHKLAESFVAIEAADAALDGAWLEGTPFAAAAAKAVAGRSARTVAKHAQQILAGIGFTLEHDLHHHVRRVLVLERLLGDTKTLTTEMGQKLLRDRALPDTLPL